MTVRTRCVDNSLVVTLDAAVLRQLPFDPSTPLQARVENGEIVLRPVEIPPEVLDAEPWQTDDPPTDAQQGFGDAFRAEFQHIVEG